MFKATAKSFPQCLSEWSIEDVIASYRTCENPAAVVEYEKHLFPRLSKYTLAIQERVKNHAQLTEMRRGHKYTDDQGMKLKRMEDNDNPEAG